MNELAQARAQKLATDRVEQTERLRQTRSQLAALEARYMRGRNASDGNEIGRVTHEIRLLELSIRGIDQDLARLSRPQPVILHTTDADELRRQRALLIQQRDYADRQRKAQEDAIRAQHKGAPEAHVRTYLANAMTNSTRTYAKTQAEFTARIDALTGQLAQLERQQLGFNGPTAA